MTPQFWVNQERDGARICITLIWLIIAALFMWLSADHYVESMKTIGLVDQVELQEWISMALPKIGQFKLYDPLREAIGNINARLFELNESMGRANRRTSRGYLIAGVVALISMMLEWRESLQKNWGLWLAFWAMIAIGIPMSRWFLRMGAANC